MSRRRNSSNCDRHPLFGKTCEPAAVTDTGKRCQFKAGRRASAIFFFLLLMGEWCQASSTSAGIPDELRGLVVDIETNKPLSRVEVAVQINEYRRWTLPGPEGVAPPKVRKWAGAHTDLKGHFLIDLREVKADLSARYPDETLVMSRLFAYANGYLNLHEAYAGPGQILRLKKKPQ